MVNRWVLTRLLVAVYLVAILTSACGIKLPDQISLPTEITGGDPKTLEAATAAAQESADRQASGDFAGVWLMMSKQVRDKISQADFVTLQNACPKAGLPIHVTGVRMDSPDVAIVRMNVDMPVLSGFKFTQTMVYEDGKWARTPDPDHAQDYGLPVEQIIAKRKATGECDKSSTTAVTTPSPSPMSPAAPSSSPVLYPPPPTKASTSDVSAALTGGTAHLLAVRLASRDDGYDRLVLEFADRVPGYTVGYRPLPAQADGSGAEIPLPGAGAVVKVALNPATADGWSGDERTYFGPSTVTADSAAVTEAKAAGDYEAVLTWVVGLRAEVPFRVLVLDGPPRLVIDFQH